MNIKFIKIVSPNNLDNERIIFNVIENDFLGNYLIAKSVSVTETRFSSHLRTTFWFPDRDVKTGDQVVLYTKNGTDFQRPSVDGKTIHFFYWGLKEPLWKNTEDVVVTTQFKTWNINNAIMGK